MKLLRALALAAAVLAEPLNAEAASERGAEVVEALQKAGCRLKPTEGSNVHALCPVEGAIGGMEALQRQGAINLTATSQAVMEQQPTIAAVRLAEFLAAHEIYRRFTTEPRLARLSVRISVAQDDSFGHPQEHMAEAFDFDRRTFSQVDWNRFNPYNFGRIGQHPMQTEWYREIAIREIRNSRR